MIRSKLQQIAVPGYDRNFHPGTLSHSGKCTEKIIGFVIIKILLRKTFLMWQKKAQRLEELVKRGENAKISVVRKVYSGCVVTIDQQTLTVKELQESVCFQKKKEGVVMISLK